MLNATENAKKPWYKILYIQTILAVLLGIAIGYFFPDFGKQLKPFSDGFIALIKMMIGPIIFCTVVHGIASIGDLSRLGRLGGKAFIYFEVVSTVALLIGLVVANTLRAGDGFQPTGTFRAVVLPEKLSTTDFILHIIPKTLVSAFTSGDLLQVLLVSILVGLSILLMGEGAAPVLRFVEYGSKIFFSMMHLVVKIAPLGALGAMGYTVGDSGIEALKALLYLMLGFYLTAAIFIFVVLGSIAWWSGFSIFRFLFYIRDELILVLGTSSSESALPRLMQKTLDLGCSRATVNFVIPTGYSFNLDGTNIYMAMGAIFWTQAMNVELSFWQQIGLLLTAMLTSKGASGVTGAGYFVLLSTLQLYPEIPIEKIGVLVGIDRFMSECRAITNFIGNGVATVVISRWEKELSAETLRENLLKNHP